MLERHPFCRRFLPAMLGAWGLLQAHVGGAGDTLWSLQPISSPAPPRVEQSHRVRNPIDAFVLRDHEAAGITSFEAADKVTLLRRACFDLIGLPPTPAQAEEFLQDRSPLAFERLVDRLLESPHYGERWARYWLDLARYAESEGFKADETRPNAWRYRDYVIKSFNEDKPYNRFVQEQIAGDELWPRDSDALVATGFNRHYPDESNARNLMQRRQEILNDMTDTVGSVFVGLTVGCAKCHDHKFDPITQEDYYSLQAFFANSAAADDIVLTSASDHEDYQLRKARWEEKTGSIREEIASLEKSRRAALIKEYVDKYPEQIQVALRKEPSERSPFEAQMVAKAMLYLDKESHQYIASSSKVGNSLKGDAKARWKALHQQLEGFAQLHPGKLPTGTGISDLGKMAPPTFVLAKGNYTAPAQEVWPRFLSVLGVDGQVSSERTGAVVGNSTGRRSALASALVDAENPLTPRVMLNRIWQYHFGRGIVETASDFGTQGALPSNPDLLDWLASEFVQRGWSIKEMHRLIMSSGTYQRSSRHQPDLAAVDPENRLLWKFPRRRLEGELIRDAALAVSGLLNPQLGGPSVYPEVPPGLTVRGGWDYAESEADANRRSIYVFVRRNTRYPFFESFDMPDTHESCARRATTTSPTQALHLLNSGLSLKWARAFADRVLRSAGKDVRHQVALAYRLAYSRDPDEFEFETIESFLREYGETPRGTESEVLTTSADAREEDMDREAFVDFCHMLLNSNEFVYLN